MKSKKNLTKEQIAIIDEIFAGQLDEETILKKYEVTRATYNKWLSCDELFRCEFNKRIEIARLQSEALIARYSLIAAAKLVQLTESEKEETARRACLDIISLPALTRAANEKEPVPEPEPAEQIELSDSAAQKLLTALAREEKG